MEINTFDIVLINVISYMGGIFTGLLICCKYKDKLLIRTRSRSRDNLSSIENQMIPRAPNYHGEPILAASAPPFLPREIIIKTTE